ncbi:MAG TPA: AraC family transcriptional regulator [Granulicella sp.]|jgi:AraC family transcriptional regulator|nr:AraC family transcriptional regulator [Granulicella sp.]
MDNSKQFLIGLEPSPPDDHVWQEYSDYSIYSAEQDPSLWSPHSHDCTQITIASNPAYVRAEWKATPGRSGAKEMNGDMVWVVPPGVQHTIHWNRRAPLLHIYLNDQFFESTMENIPDKISSKLAPSLLVRDPFLVQMGKELYRELQFGPISELFTKSVATLTATHLIRTYSGKPSSITVYRGGLGPSRERKVRKYIQENLDQPLSLDDLAKIALVSPNYFISLFQQSTGLTPHKYVLQQRVEYAKELLAYSKLSLIEIAHKCGFPDQSQFTTTFRRHLGVTPGQYKRQL